jgi:MFS family permease
VIPIIFTNHFYQFALLRFLTGISVGGEYSAIFAIVDEIVPK